ncbi:hypothetical protein BDV38DRAFT_270472 [Aspergillus pseudotamarii]|uniref:AttH domain-containing protein n=1 Tax=Aspergillus pseudotamarii TaxID=132259 RepID=A0A5N6SZR0_ASPPS|nr:uncharacterized protein BDV38DRAFT_270472 [Aspergillus pseudotamarii]KAE8138614.1 hypothetical protein BDV38DRAFT_270472 [Aspergillus pseudotamarii]
MQDLTVVFILLAALIAGVFGFIPETGGLQYERLVRNSYDFEHSTMLTILLPQTKPIQLTQDLGASQFANPIATNSWWSSSFVHASDGHDYLIVSHVILPNLNLSTALLRASILDINDIAYYRQVSWLHNGSSRATQMPNGPPGVATKNFGFVSVDPANPLDKMRIWCITEHVELDLTFQLSAPVILNGGTGTFPFGDETTLEWSMPAGITDGYFTANRKLLTIDSARSLTWYDRQLIWAFAPLDGPVRSNWTWFQVHHGERTMSIWAWDTLGGQRFQFATVRDKPGIHQVLVVTEFTPSSRQWTSPCSKTTYSLDWTVALVDGTRLELSSVRDDQELCTQDGAIATYEGYINVAGTRGGKPISGYGLVEIAPVTAIPKPT